MVQLLDLPHEVLNSIFVETEASDLAASIRTCHRLRSFVSHNHLLYREIYLRTWVSLVGGVSMCTVAGNANQVTRILPQSRRMR